MSFRHNKFFQVYNYLQTFGSHRFQINLHVVHKAAVADLLF